MQHALEESNVRNFIDSDRQYCLVVGGRHNAINNLVPETATIIKKNWYFEFLNGVCHKPTLYCLRRRLEACNFGFRKKSDCNIGEAKTKMLIS